MRISRTRNFKCNLGNYESFGFGATVTVDHQDFGHSDESLVNLTPDEHATLVEDINRYAEDMLGVIMKGEINEAAGMTTEQKSVVLQIVTPPPLPNRNTSRKMRKP